MKSFRRILSLLLVIALTLTFVSTFYASDETQDNHEESLILGDIDQDGEITIIDGTLLQFYCAELKTLTDNAVLKGDTNLDGDTEVMDVTHLQRFIALVDGQYYLGMEIDSAKAKKSDDEEAARIEAESIAAQKAEAEKAAQAQKEADAQYKADVAAMKERTNAAKAAYKAKLKEINKNSLEAKKAEVDSKIKNYKKTKGVDISEFNGNVDFNKLKAAGYTFVMIRLGYGSNIYSQDDAKFEQNVKRAEAAGMPWGAYIYSYALNTSSATSEVKHTLRLLQGKKPTMPIAFDLEEDEYKDSHGMTNKALHDVTVTYMKGIAAAGYYPILYTGYDWLKGPLNTKDVVGSYDIWYAQWYTVMQYNTSRVGMWQYGGDVNYIESPYIKGLSGAFDKDYCFKNYPVLIPNYGYNNHVGLFDKKLAPTAESLYGNIYIEDGEKIPDEYNRKGVMGESFRDKAIQSAE